jgi:hypothetical protein
MYDLFQPSQAIRRVPAYLPYHRLMSDYEVTLVNDNSRWPLLYNYINLLT